MEKFKVQKDKIMKRSYRYQWNSHWKDLSQNLEK